MSVTEELQRAHLQRLRDLNRRISACDEAGNSNGCEHIQKLIDAENLRWSLVNLSHPSTNEQK